MTDPDLDGANPEQKNKIIEVPISVFVGLIGLSYCLLPHVPSR